MAATHGPGGVCRSYDPSSLETRDIISGREFGLKDHSSLESMYVKCSARLRKRKSIQGNRRNIGDSLPTSINDVIHD